MAFLDFLTTTKDIRRCAMAPSINPNLSDNAKELYDAMMFDLCAAEAENTIHNVSSHWLTRLTGLDFKDTSDAYENLIQESCILENDKQILIRSVLDDHDLKALKGAEMGTQKRIIRRFDQRRVSEKACKVAWLAKEFPKRIKAVGGAGGISSQRSDITKAFLASPFWFYDMALAILEYLQPFEKRGLRFWEDARAIADSQYGDLNTAIKKYLALFEEMPKESEWEQILITKYANPIEPTLDGAVATFLRRIESGDICPLKGGKPSRVRMKREADSDIADALEKCWRIHEKIEKLRPSDSANIGAYLDVSRRIMEYAEAHPEFVFRICAGAPYETIQKEVTSYLEDWPYYDLETKKKADEVIRTVATPCIEKHFENLREAHINKFNASMKIMKELFGEEEK